MVFNSATNLVQTVIDEAFSLKDFLYGLDAKLWAQDSTSEGWTIEDVVSHLAGGANGWATNIARAVAGDSEPPEGQSFLPPGERGSHPSGPVARESRNQSGARILDAFDTGHARLRKVLKELHSEDWDKPCFHRRGVLPVKAYVGLQLQELVLHSWDIRWGLDKKADISEISLPFLIDLVPRWLSSAFMPDLALPLPVRYRFDVSSPMTLRKDLVITGNAYHSSPCGTEVVDATFKGDTGNYILLMFGRLQVERAVADGRLSVEGSMEQAKKFNAWFKGF